MKKKPVNPYYGSKIAQIAQHLGISVSELAGKLSLSTNTVRKYSLRTESPSIPSVDFLKKIILLIPDFNIHWWFFDLGDIRLDENSQHMKMLELLENERNLILKVNNLQDQLIESHKQVGALMSKTVIQIQLKY